MSGADSQFRITRPFVYRSESSRAATANPTGIPTARSHGAPESRLALTDPVVHVVTDFAWEQPMTVPEEISIDAALREALRGLSTEETAILAKALHRVIANLSALDRRTAMASANAHGSMSSTTNQSSGRRASRRSGTSIGTS